MSKPPPPPSPPPPAGAHLVPPPPPPPAPARGPWAKFRNWPIAAQVAVWTLLGLIGFAAISPQDKPADADPTGPVTTTSVVAVARFAPNPKVTTTSRSTATAAPTTIAATLPPSTPPPTPTPVPVPVPVPVAPAPPPTQGFVAPAPTAALAPPPTVYQPPSTAYYANCTEARNAGAAPLYQGQPGYRPALDRDHDGVACET